MDRSFRLFRRVGPAFAESFFSLFFLFVFPLPFREIWTRSMEFLNRAILNFNLSTADFYANFREKRWKDQGSGIRFISLEYHIMR